MFQFNFNRSFILKRKYFLLKQPHFTDAGGNNLSYIQFDLHMNESLAICWGLFDRAN